MPYPANVKNIEARNKGLISARPVSTGVCTPQTIPTAPPYCVTWVQVWTSSALTDKVVKDKRLKTKVIKTITLFISIADYTLE